MTASGNAIVQADGRRVEGAMLGRRTLLQSLAAGLALSATDATLAAPAPQDSAPALPPGVAGMATIVIEKGRPDALRLAGHASLAFDIPVSSRTLFQIGSVSKHVTAVALLRLAEQGKVDLDKPLSAYLDGLEGGWGSPTLAQILTHSGGLPPDFVGQEWDRPIDREAVRAFSRRLPAIARPGHSWVYSNVGYVMLGYVIENVAGASYGDHVVRELFRPNGLVDSRLDDGEAIIANKAEPVVWTGESFRRPLQMSTSVSGVAAGGLLMSPRDIPAWEAALSGSALLSDASKRLMWSSASYATGRPTGYGMGWWIRTDTAGAPMLWHTGSVPGFRSFYLRRPASGSALVILLAGETRTTSLGLATTERQWPGSTAFGAKPIVDKAPALSRALLDLLQFKAGSATVPLAPELADLPPALLDDALHPLSQAEAASIATMQLVSDQTTRIARERIYRVTTAKRTVFLAAGYTPDGRLYQLAV